MPRPVATYAPVTATHTSRQAFARALVSATSLAVRLEFNAWSFRALMLLYMFVYGVEASSSLGSGEYGTRLLATSGMLAPEKAPQNTPPTIVFNIHASI